MPPRNISLASCLAGCSTASRLFQPAAPGCIERDHYNRPSITTLHITHYKLPASLSFYSKFSAPSLLDHCSARSPRSVGRYSFLFSLFSRTSSTEPHETLALVKVSKGAGSRYLSAVPLWTGWPVIANSCFFLRIVSSLGRHIDWNRRSPREIPGAHLRKRPHGG